MGFSELHEGISYTEFNAVKKQLANTMRENERLLTFLNKMAYGQLPDGDIIPLPVVMHIERFLDELRYKESADA